MYKKDCTYRPTLRLKFAVLKLCTFIDISKNIKSFIH